MRNSDGAPSAWRQTPVASPVNALIIAPGQYRAVDFLKIGLPLQLIALVLTVLLVPWVFPLHTA